MSARFLFTRVFYCLSLLSCVSPAAAQQADSQATGQAKLIATDFGALGAAINNEQQWTPTITGEIAAPWMDESNWADVAVRYQAVREPQADFMRVSVSQAKRGWAQFLHPLPPIMSTLTGAVRAKVRATSGLTITLGFRQRAEPYAWVWQSEVKPTGAWQEIDVPFEFATPGKTLGFYVMLQGEGAADFDAFTIESSGPPAAAAPGGVYIDESFDAARGKPQAITGDKVNGRIPSGWLDESSWAPLKLDYTLEREGDRPFQRMRISTIDGGRAQLVHPLPQVSEDSLFVMEATVRGAAQSVVTFAVRQREAPYEIVWTEKVPLNTDWQDVRFTFTPRPTDQAVGFYISYESVGQLDLARVRLTETTRQAYEKQLESQHPDGGPRNLIEQSRFPLGLPPGWDIMLAWGDDRGDDPAPDAEVEAVADGSTTGPSGFTPLRVTSHRAFLLNSAPFVPLLSHRPHVASIYLKGNVRGNLSVRADDKELATRRVELGGSDWQRVELPFQPTLTGKSYQLRIEHDGECDYLLDGVQVEVGEKAKEYVSREEFEVALGVTSPVFLHFEDEPAEYTWAVTGGGADAVLRSRVLNLYGDVADQPAVKLQPGQESQQATARYDLFGKRPLGSHRIEAWVERGGERVSPISELVINRIRRPRYWGQDAPQSPFGAHFLSNRYDITFAKAVGVNWVRLHDSGSGYIGWRWVEPAKGQWSFRDNKIKRFRDAHLTILGMLSTSPNWASVLGEGDGYWHAYGQPKDYSEYGTYVRAITERHKNDIRAWEVWNEPWISEFWSVRKQDGIYRHSEQPQADYARLMQVAYENAKSIDPGLAIVGINTTANRPEPPRIIGGTDWTSGVLAAGALEHCDIISYHNYMGGLNGFAGDGVESGFDYAFSPLLAQHGGEFPKPVWMTEGNSGGYSPTGFYRHTLAQPDPSDPVAVADNLARYVVAMFGQGIERVFLYSMHTRGSHWAVFINFDGSPHPGAIAHSNLAWHLEDTRFSERFSVAAGVEAYLFEGDGRAVAVLSPRSAGDYAVPAIPGAAARDLWGNEILPGTPMTTTLVYISAARPAAELREALVR